jgi:Putative zinc-finger
MTRPFPDAIEPATGADRHAGEQLLACYATGALEPVAVWSVEAHLMGCARCRSALSPYVDAGRLARNRSVLLVRAAVPDGRARRLLSHCGVPDHVLRLLAATPSLRASWLLSVTGVLAVVAGEAAAAGYRWQPASGLAGHPAPAALVAFLLVAPLLVLAGVAAAFLPAFDPACSLAVAAPFSGLRLLLIRAVAAVTASLILVAGAALVLPGPGWLPAAMLLPTLALCTFAVAAATVLDPMAAAVTAAFLWALPALALAATHAPLAIVHGSAQSVSAAVLCASAVALFLRRHRFELGWTR